MRKKRIITLILSFITIAAALGSCGKKLSDDSGLPKIAVSIVPEATFAEAVCGNLAKVVTLIPPGYSPENYEPTPEIMANLEDADIYFTIGVPSEESGILPGVGKDVKIVALEDEVAAAYPDLTFADGGRDPHIWLSPKRVKVMVSAIARELCVLDPDNADTYNANATAYLAQLDNLDTSLKATFNALDANKKSFIVFHPAFGYLADDYGLTMYALQEEGKEATASRMQELIDFAKKEGIKAIFYQSEIDSRQSQSFADELGGKTIMLEPLAADYIANLEKMASLMSETME
jgi:ABC-type metal ion transport system, periplasmic component/surface adhesin